MSVRQFVKSIPVVGSFSKRVFIAITHVIRSVRILRWTIDTHDVTLMSDEQKRERIVEIARQFQTKVFVETGTFMGKTSRFVAPSFQRCVTIEVDRDLYERASAHLQDLGNVSVLHGDSAKLMPAILESLDEPALFWLDAHYSGGVTSRADEDTPIQKELRLILDHHVKNHVILIDDVRDFLGVEGYPTVRALRHLVRTRGHGYGIRIQNDLMLIYPYPR